ncbi:MAG: protein kinase [Oscillochloris sp.]|nr:protein kinase [Oscillochloris sp.]
MSELNLVGTSLGRFEILSELGRGGMAVVYRARQADLDREVALKVLPPALTHDASYVARFRQEARSVARLEHPHIVPIYEIGEANGLHYIAMKFIQGGTLKELLEREGPLTVARSAQILAQVGAALDYAHRQGVIHRDIKPSNMMITAEGWIYLTDFGLARGAAANTGGLTMAGTVMGTPEYMSPEQAQGLPNVGPATDIYALGVVLYEMLTGVFPFQADTPMGMLAARLLQAPTPPRDVRGDLIPAAEDVVMRALARKPEARFASAADMIETLRRAAGISASQAQRPLSPAAGTPAIGATVVATPTPPPLAPHVTPLPTLPATPTPAPYVRPATPQVAPPATRIANPQPQFGAIPSLPQTPVAPPLPAQPRSRTGLWIGLGTGALVLLLAVIGGLMLIGRGTGDVPPVANDSGIEALIRSGDPQLMSSSQLAAAEQTAQSILAAEDDDLAALAKLALISNLRSDLNPALERADALIAAADDNGSAAALGYALRADTLISQGNYPAALEAADAAIERDPALAIGHAVRSSALSAQANSRNDVALMDTALESLDQAVDAQADESPVLQALTANALAYTEAQEYLLSGNQEYLQASEASYNAAIDLAPGLALFHSNLGYLFNLTGATDDARAQFEAALERDPDYDYAQSAIGWSYYLDGDDSAAARAFDAAIELDDSAYDAYYGLGRLAFDERDYETAAEQFQAALERNDQNAEVQTYLGEALLFIGFNQEDADVKADSYAAAEDAYRGRDRHQPRLCLCDEWIGLDITVPGSVRRVDRLVRAGACDRRSKR